jgi:hypothetical protein
VTQQQADPTATPMTVLHVQLLVLQADASPILGNEDVPVVLCMERAALQHAEIAVSSPDGPPECAHWLKALRDATAMKEDFYHRFSPLQKQWFTCIIH